MHCTILHTTISAHTTNRGFLDNTKIGPNSVVGGILQKDYTPKKAARVLPGLFNTRAKNVVANANGCYLFMGPPATYAWSALVDGVMTNGTVRLGSTAPVAVQLGTPPAVAANTAG